MMELLVKYSYWNIYHFQSFLIILLKRVLLIRKGLKHLCIVEGSCGFTPEKT